MNEPTPQQKPERFMKVMKFAAIVTVLVIGAGIWRFVCSLREHGQRVAEARRVFDSNDAAHWQQLFDEVKDLVLNNPGVDGFPMAKWPPSIAVLKPYMVDYHQGEVWMNWTGGFDEETLHLNVAVTASQRAPGIYVDDSKHEGDMTRCVFRPPAGLR